MMPPTAAAPPPLPALLLSAVFVACGSAGAPRAQADVSNVRAAAPSPGVTRTDTFDRKAAKSVIGVAAEQAKHCGQPGGPSGPGRVQVVYKPSGKVTSVALLTERFENTATGSCIRLLFRSAKVPAFTGVATVLVDKTFEIP